MPFVQGKISAVERCASLKKALKKGVETKVSARRVHVEYGFCNGRYMYLLRFQFFFWTCPYMSRRDQQLHHFIDRCLFQPAE